MQQALILCAKVDERIGRRLDLSVAQWRAPRSDGGGGGGRRAEAHLEVLEATGAMRAGAMDALRRSDALIVICSPDAARATPIAEALRIFLAEKPAARILCVIARGEPGASVILGREREECVPALLRPGAAADAVKREPPSVDARPQRDEWTDIVTRAAAAARGDDPERLAAAERARRKARRYVRGGVAASLIGIGAALAYMQLELRGERAEAERRVAYDAVHAALDEGREWDAIRLLDDALPRPFRSAQASPAARAALTRVKFETRLLADFPAPAPAEEIALLPSGVIAVVEPSGATHLVDPLLGDATTVYRPKRPSFMRISRDRRTLWTAHFEPTRKDDAGEAFAPLVFEEVDLATGDISLATAVRSLPPVGGSGDISPDGALFAVDLGPGARNETLIAAFSREAQELAGVVSIPSDRATLRFVGPDRLLIRTDPPNPTHGAFGLHLWTVGEAAASRLFTPQASTACEGAEDGAAATPVVAFSPDEREVALLRSGGPSWSCLSRWRLPGGERASDIALNGAPKRLASLGVGGPYLTGDGEAGAGLEMRATDAARPTLRLPRCEGPEVRLLPQPGGGGAVACLGARGALYFGGGGAIAWRGEFHDGGVETSSYDPATRRLHTIGADRRLRIWDASSRFVKADTAAPADAPKSAPPSAAQACRSALAAEAEDIVANPGGDVVAVRDQASGSIDVYDLIACAPLFRTGVEAAATLSFVGDRRLRFGFEAEAAEVDLAIDLDAARIALSARRRAFKD